MAEYRVPEFTIEQRLEVVQQMLNTEREWGLVSKLAGEYGVSRNLLYKLREKGREAIREALQAEEAGRPVQEGMVKVDKTLIDRVITILPLLKGSVGDIRLGLDLILGVSRSAGYISQKLKAVGEAAEGYNLGLRVPLPILGEADEIFQGRKPCLTLVDGRSFLVLNLTPAESRDGTTWGLTYLDMMERGFEFQDLVCDGGTGLRAGVEQAELVLPLYSDLFHVLQKAQVLTRSLEGAAYKSIETAERARRDDLEQRGIIRRRGRRLKIKLPLPQAELQEAQAIESFDTWTWLLREIRLALEPISPVYHLVSVSQTKATLETALELLKHLHHSHITTFANDLQKKMTQLLAPLAWLEPQLRPTLNTLDAQTQHFILWAWQHRQSLSPNLDTDFSEQLRPIVRSLWDTLTLFHRSSSLAEAFHSWLRPYLQIHRGMPSWLLPLLQLFWNHHVFERGKRAGSSPLELAGVDDAPSFSHLLNHLLSPDPCQLLI